MKASVGALKVPSGLREARYAPLAGFVAADTPAKSAWRPPPGRGSRTGSEIESQPCVIVSRCSPVTSCEGDGVNVAACASPPLP